MVKALMNDAERYLLKNWADARLLESAMEGVRTRYKEVFQRITEAVTDSHPEFDTHRFAVTQFWTDGCLGFGRKSWPGGESRWPSGLWLNGLRLEELAAEDSEPPCASIWFSNKSKSELDVDAARCALEAVAKELLAPEELKGVTSGEGKGDLLYFPSPSKAQLLDALSEGDGQGFVGIFVSQFDMMARFVSALDKVFRECLTKR
jgi:hypothetical protein